MCHTKCALLSTLLLQIAQLLLLCSTLVAPHDMRVEDLPALLDANDIEHFFEQNRLDDLHWALHHAFRRSARNPNLKEIVFPTLPDQLVSRGGGSTYTTAYKLTHDAEQAEYLAHQEILKDSFQNRVLPVYRKTLDSIPPLDKLEKNQGLYPFQPQDEEIRSLYNKALHHTNMDQLRDNEGNILPLLNPALDADRIEQAWEDTGVVVVDDILSPLALERIRRIMLESTVWYQTKMPKRFGGYVGAYIDDGLNDKILLQLAWELYRALPRIMTGNYLRYLWAYKYDSDYTGINIHADEAAVNVNLWLTPDSANLDPTSGGLVIFTAKPPSSWDFADYNTNPDRVYEELLKPTDFANITVPHRQNRAVLFDSALFHQTDEFRFRQGYENRRINLTLLYGKMRKTQQKDEL